MKRGSHRQPVETAQTGGLFYEHATLRSDLDPGAYKFTSFAKSKTTKPNLSGRKHPPTIARKPYSWENPQ